MSHAHDPHGHVAAESVLAWHGDEQEQQLRDALPEPHDAEATNRSGSRRGDSEGHCGSRLLRFTSERIAPRRTGQALEAGFAVSK